MVMVPLMSLIIGVLAFCDISDVGLSLGLGLSAKNLLVYMGVGLLFLQSRMGKQYKFELREMYANFAILIVYSTISIFIVAGLVHYQGYKASLSAIVLKTGLIDWLMFFVLFFYGTSTIGEARGLIKLLLVAVSATNAFTIAKVVGLTQYGATVIGSSEDSVGRVQGVLGDANETATIISCLIPVYIAAAVAAKGVMGKLFWIGAMGASVTVMFMTASRGALIGLIAGGLWAAYLCRKQVSYARAIRWGGIALVVLIIVAAVFARDYLDAYIHRFTAVNTASAASMTSGRTEIWGRALAAMVANPISLITGFGWNAWSVMGFHFVAHNHYLWLWFELGIVGVVCFILLYRQAVSTVFAKISAADPTDRYFMVSFVFSFLILAVGIFFVLLFKGWFYLWVFFGLALRYALLLKSPTQEQAAAETAKKPARRRRPAGAVKISPGSARSRS